MTFWEALLLGILQGLTEFLPVSSSGHLELGKVLLGVETRETFTFTILVHGATVLSTIVVFWQDLVKILKGFFRFQWNEETKFVLQILISMVPVGILGVFFKEEIESFFSGNLLLVGPMLLVTALLLFFSSRAPDKGRPINFRDAFVIGLFQALAVIPGISRSGSTISAGLLLGNRRAEVARFSFLMVLLPVIGANILDILSYEPTTNGQEAILPLLVGFTAAFISGLLACRWMIRLVQKGRLIDFAIYCMIIGTIAIVAGFMQ